MPRPRYFAVVPAAGAGRRFGTEHPKQYARLAGRRVIDLALEPLLQHPLIAAVIVALAPGDEHWRETEAARNGAVRTVPGGRERQQSVLHCLEALAERCADEDWVLVHDAARPCLRAADLGRLIEALRDHPLGGLLAVPVRDTLKRAAPDAHAAMDTLDRQGLWQAQTPQLFRYGPLARALQTARQQETTVTDEAQAIEHTGQSPVLVPGSPDNLKLTTPADLTLAAAILRARDT